MLLTRIEPTTETKLIDQEAGILPGKLCCTQVLNLNQHIKDGYEQGLIMGAALIDLTAAYDSEPLKSVQKFYELTEAEDVILTKLTRTMLSNHCLLSN